MKRFTIIFLSLCVCALFVWTVFPENNPRKAEARTSLSALEAQIAELQAEMADKADRQDINDLMPIGTIVMWSGEISDAGHPILDGTELPDWHLCDGTDAYLPTTSVPNLIDRFIMGADNQSVAVVGGNNALVLSSDNLPAHAHQHNITVDWIEQSHRHRTMSMEVESLGDDNNHHIYISAPWLTSYTYSASTSHDHGISGGILETGQSVPFDNRPSYYSLAFIIKVN